MARITPRFLTRTTAASHRHADEVPAKFGACMSGHPDRGEVSFSLTRDEPGEPRVYVALTYAEAERLGKFAEEMRKGKPLQHHMKHRVYIIDGKYRVKVRGWFNGEEWENDTSRLPESPYYPLSQRMVKALYAMAETTSAEWVIDGTTVKYVI